MDGFKLRLDEVAALLDYPEEDVSRLIEHGTLLAEGSGNALRISINSVAHYVGVAAEQTAVSGVQRVLHDPVAWASVFGSAPGSVVPAEFNKFPASIVGNSLIRAVEIANIRSV